MVIWYCGILQRPFGKTKSHTTSHFIKIGKRLIKTCFHNFKFTFYSFWSCVRRKRGVSMDNFIIKKQKWNFQKTLSWYLCSNARYSAIISFGGPVKHLRLRFLREYFKMLIISIKSSIFNVWQGSDYGHETSHGKTPALSYVLNYFSS